MTTRSTHSRFRPAAVWSRIALAAFCLFSFGCLTPELLNERAERQLADGRLVEAEESLNLAEEKRPSNWKTQFLMGELRLAQGRPLDAQVALERAWSMRAIHPETPEILDRLAEAMLAQGSEAEGKLRRFLTEMTGQYGTPYDYVRKGVFLMRLNDADGAMTAFNQARAVGADQDIRLHLALAAFYRQIGDQRLETLSLRHALFLEPQNEDVAGRLRELGVVPGPSAELAPPRR